MSNTLSPEFSIRKKERKPKISNVITPSSAETSNHIVSLSRHSTKICDRCDRNIDS